MLIGSMFKQLACCIHIFVFFLLKKLLFFKLNRSSTDSFLSSPSFFFSQQKLLQSRSIKVSGGLVNRFLTTSRSIEKLFVWPIDSRQLLNPSKCFCRRQILDSTSTDELLSRFSARQISTDTSIHRATISIQGLSAKLDFIFSSLSQQKTFSLALNTSHSLKNFYPCVLRPRSRSKHLVSVLIFSLFMHSSIINLGFGVFQNFWGF